MSNFLLKALQLIQNAQTVFSIITPVLETLVKKDLNNDGKVGIRKPRV